MLKNFYEKIVDYLRNHKLLFSLAIIFLLLFIIPVRCSPIISMQLVDNIPLTHHRTCISAYNKEFWINHEVLTRDVEFIWGFAVLKSWLAGDNVQHKNKIQTTIISA